MSYSKIKAIKVTKDGVFFNTADSNVFDLDGKHVYRNVRSDYFSNLYNTDKTLYLKVILENFWNGNFQGGSIIYSQLVSYLRIKDKNSKFNWQSENHNKSYTNDELYDYLLNEFNLFKELKKDKSKYVLEVGEGMYKGYYIQNKDHVNTMLHCAKKYSFTQIIKEIENFNKDLNLKIVKINALCK